jgi:hypothetical protein
MFRTSAMHMGPATARPAPICAKIRDLEAPRASRFHDQVSDAAKIADLGIDRRDRRCRAAWRRLDLRRANLCRADRRRTAPYLYGTWPVRRRATGHVPCNCRRAPGPGLGPTTSLARPRRTDLTSDGAPRLYGSWPVRSAAHVAKFRTNAGRVRTRGVRARCGGPRGGAGRDECESGDSGAQKQNGGGRWKAAASSTTRSRAARRTPGTRPRLRSSSHGRACAAGGTAPPGSCRQRSAWSGRRS